MDIDYKKLGERIKERRQELGLTQDKLAERVGIVPSHVSSIECALRTLSLGTLQSFVNALDTTYDVLLIDSINNIELVTIQDILKTLEGCSPGELKICSEMLKATLSALRSNGYEK